MAGQGYLFLKNANLEEKRSFPLPVISHHKFFFFLEVGELQNAKWSSPVTSLLLQSRPGMSGRKWVERASGALASGTSEEKEKKFPEGDAAEGGSGPSQGGSARPRRQEKLQGRPSGVTSGADRKSLCFAPRWLRGCIWNIIWTVRGGCRRASGLREVGSGPRRSLAPRKPGGEPVAVPQPQGLREEMLQAVQGEGAGQQARWRPVLGVSPASPWAELGRQPRPHPALASAASGSPVF